MPDALLCRHRPRPLSGLTGNVGGGGGGVARHVAEPGMPEQVVPVGMGGEPGDHRNAEPVHVIGELVQLGAIDAGIDQDQPILPAHRDGIGPDPLALPDPDAVSHLIQLAHPPSDRLVAVLRRRSAAKFIAFRGEGLGDDCVEWESEEIVGKE